MRASTKDVTKMWVCIVEVYYDIYIHSQSGIKFRGFLYIYLYNLLGRPSDVNMDSAIATDPLASNYDSVMTFIFSVSDEILPVSSTSKYV